MLFRSAEYFSNELSQEAPQAFGVDSIAEEFGGVQDEVVQDEDGG